MASTPMEYAAFLVGIEGRGPPKDVGVVSFGFGWFRTLVPDVCEEIARRMKGAPAARLSGDRCWLVFGRFFG